MSGSYGLLSSPPFSLASTLSLLLILINSLPRVANAAGGGGQWKLLQDNIGIVAMHMQLLHNDRVIILDRTDFGLSNISLPDGKCREDPNEKAVKEDCTAHSVEYDVFANSIRPLMVQTDVWCSSGSVFPDGRLVQTGGFNDGDHKVRTFTPCPTCDWVEVGDELKYRRWYATNQKLPDGSVIIVGGRRQFNYEFYPKGTTNPDSYNLPFLVQTNDRLAENNLYPFVFLNVDGNLFMFANTKAILFDFKLSKVVRTYPDIPGGDPRCYPSSGSAVLLPIRDLPGNRSSNVSAEILVCGGAPKGSFQQANDSNVFITAVDTCGRIRITDPTAQWAMEKMPMPRVMNDMTLLPNGDVLIVNGCGSGTAGWELGRDPVHTPVIYHPDIGIGSRFEQGTLGSIPRMYHSTAILVRNGWVLVGGSNPHARYNFTGVLFPTELRLEAYYPPYLDSQFDSLRPKIVGSTATVGYGQVLVIRFQVTGPLVTNLLSVTMVSPSFTTHSFSMNQRLIVLVTQNVTSSGFNSLYDVQVKTPGSNNLAPAGYYMLFVVHQKIPGQGIWVQIK